MNSPTPITKTDFNFTGQTLAYHGKVRDMYGIGDDLIVAVVSDRISAFDVVMPRGIPYKGQVLNGVASTFLDAVSDIVPTWKIATPDPSVTIGHKCEPIRLEMVIRGYLTGHAWRTYNKGLRELCGAKLPEGMKEHDRFPTPIITPATKAEEGHDEDIAPADIVSRGIVSADLYAKLERVTRALFQRGTEIAAKQGLILVDTKYESPSERRPWPLLSPHDRSHHSPPSVELLELPSLSRSVATEEPSEKTCISISDSDASWVISLGTVPPTVVVPPPAFW